MSTLRMIALVDWSFMGCSHRLPSWTQLDKDADERLTRQGDYIVGQVSNLMEVGAARETAFGVTLAPTQHHLGRMMYTKLCLEMFSLEPLATNIPRRFSSVSTLL